MFEKLISGLTPVQLKIIGLLVGLLAFLGILLGAYFYGRNDGANANEAKWTKWQNDYFNELNKKISDIQDYAAEQTGVVKKGNAATNAKINSVLEEIRKNGPTVVYNPETQKVEFGQKFQQNWSKINKEAN